MPTAIFSLLTFLLMCQISTAGLITYQGTLKQLSRDGQATPVKEFDVEIHVDETGQHAFYLVSESTYSLPWYEQYGQVTLDASAQKSHVAIAYQHEQRDYVLPVSLPYFPDFERLAHGASWNTEGTSYEVLGEENVGMIRCWKVRVKSGPARYQTLSVKQDSPIVVTGKQTVFMGQGDKFEIDFTATSMKALKEEDTQQRVVIEGKLLSLQTSLERDDNNRLASLNTTQVAIAEQQTPALLEQANGGVFDDFVKRVHDDVIQRSQRKTRVEDLAVTFMNRPAPKFTLLKLDGTPLPASRIENSIVVLHFWSYQNSPLEQPYGQIGYLDFLKNRWAIRNVEVIGVAIDSRLTSPDTLDAARRSIRKLQQFMKLSYEITYDGGAVLNAFGNPTRLGEELPLWVVIDSDGTVAHYQTGYFTIDPQKGLKELDELIERLAKPKE